jgi:hypothetical protein
MAITINQPTTGQLLAFGASQTIQWNAYAGAVATYRIALSPDGTTFSQIGQVNAPTVIYPWTVGGISSSTSVIRVQAFNTANGLLDTGTVNVTIGVPGPQGVQGLQGPQGDPGHPRALQRWSQTVRIFCGTPPTQPPAAYEAKLQATSYTVYTPGPGEVIYAAWWQPLSDAWQGISGTGDMGPHFALIDVDVGPAGEVILRLQKAPLMTGKHVATIRIGVVKGTP